MKSKLLSNKKLLQGLGERIRLERLKQGISQEELADKANLHRTYIGMIERAEKNITISNLERIAKALSSSISELTKGL